MAAEEFRKALSDMQSMALTGRKSWSGRERNCCFLNTKTDWFADISAVSGFDFVDDGRAAALVDWDFDGDQDIWLINRTGPQIRFLRNDTPSTNHFLGIRLVGDGKTVNKDAIGARVTVFTAGNPQGLIKTLRAGEGYLSQSSKWLHFGLGNASSVDRLIIHWPGAKAVEFTNLSGDRFYVIAQGDSKPKEWIPAKRPDKLMPSELATLQPSRARRTVLTKRVPMPELSFKDLAGSVQRLSQWSNQPVLINLWASWCSPCTHELTDMTAHESSLRGVDLQIIALNVDGGGQDEASTTAAEQVVRRIAFPFAAGVASQELMNKLEVLVYAMCVTQKPIPIPTSLLIDRKGRLAVVYRGEVSMEQLLSDIRLLDTDEDQLRTAALPFPGREHDVSNLLNLAMVASRFAEDGFVEDAASYLSAYEQQIAKGKERAGHPLHYKAHYNLAVAFSERGNFDKAVSHYERATKLNPKYVTALFNLAVLLANHDQDDRAIGIYRDVLRFDPHFVKAHNNLGLLLGKRGRSTEAEKQFRQALKVAPRSLDVRNNLGNLLVRTARISEAVEQLRQGLEVDPRDANTNYNLGVAFAKQRDFTSAARHFRTATETDPQNVLAHHNLSLSLLAMGNVEEAHVFAQKAVSLDSSYQPARKVLTRILTLLDESAHK